MAYKITKKNPYKQVYGHKNAFFLHFVADSALFGNASRIFTLLDILLIVHLIIFIFLSPVPINPVETWSWDAILFHL